jgi:hypothetical protein
MVCHNKINFVIFNPLSLSRLGMLNLSPKQAGCQDFSVDLFTLAIVDCKETPTTIRQDTIKLDRHFDDSHNDNPFRV